jgi:hypothetical protein
MDANDLLGGPRGRQLCSQLMGCDLGRLAETQPPAAFLDALAATVSAARYWQEPAEVELADPDLDRRFLPIAEAVIAAPASQWWSSPIARDDQYEVLFDHPSEGPNPVADRDAHAALVRWRADELADERSATTERPADPTANWTGHWWSAPVAFGLITSTRTIAPTGPIGLSLVEDALDFTAAQCRPLQVRSDASVFEITSPDDWIELVRSYPLPVPNSRHHDWWRATGHDLKWAIPDYLAVAEDFDGIHLSVAGYLSTAGRSLAVGAAATVLAGWDPDQTWWLTDSVQPAGSPTRWTASSMTEPLSWRPTTS